MIVTLSVNYLFLNDSSKQVHSVKISKDKSANDLKELIKNEIGVDELVLWMVDHPISEIANIRGITSLGGNELVRWKANNLISEKEELEQPSVEVVNETDEKGFIEGKRMDDLACTIKEVFPVPPATGNIHIVVATLNPKSTATRYITAKCLAYAAGAVGTGITAKHLAYAAGAVGSGITAKRLAYAAGAVGTGITRKRLAYAAGAVGTGIIAAPWIVPAAACAVGFGSGGIVGGTWAAGFMASYGGSVGAGSACAVLQSIGAVGAISTSASITTTVVGATVVARAASVLQEDEVDQK